MLEIHHYPFPPPGDAAPVEREPYPAPLRTSLQPADEPGLTAAGLLMLAASRGWQGVITHAEGFLPHAAYGTPSKAPKKSEAVRLARGEQRAVAVNMGGAWSSLWTWSREQFFTRHANLEAFREALR